MKKTNFIIICLLVIIVCCGCMAANDKFEKTDYGNAGIYDLDGNLLVSYKTLVKKYNFNISKDYENEENKGFLKVIKKLDLNEDIILIIPEVNKIGAYALSYVNNLAYCELPETLETIGEYAFYSSGLKEIRVPGSVSKISNNAFDSCRELSKVTLNEGLKIIDISAFKYTSKLTEISIPKSVEVIGSCAFESTGINYVHIPDTVGTIGDYAFGNAGTVCYNGSSQVLTGFGAVNFHNFNNSNTCELCGATLEYVPYLVDKAEFIDNGVCDIPESFERDGIKYKVYAIGIEAYKDNEDIRVLKIPDSIRSIQSKAFMNCINLEQVNLNKNLENLGGDVFCGCSSIQEIVIPEKVSTITGCFSECTNLRSITLPREIGLSTMDFMGCYNIEKVYYCGTEEEWNSKTVGAPPPVMRESINSLFDEKVDIIFCE